jgi:acetolactate decarboxylase
MKLTLSLVKAARRCAAPLAAAAALTLAAGCFWTGAQDRKIDDNVSQVSTINALMMGDYDGKITLEELSSLGDTGIGTFDKLDGEMVLLDGVFYQIRADGSVVKPDGSFTSPFACVSFFEEDFCLSLPHGASMADALKMIDAAAKNKNLFLTVKIQGTFQKVKARSVPPQKKPYPPLAEVAKKQSVFEFKDIKGTIVGFRCPDFVKGINVPGYHLHFISADGKKGGHVLDFTLEEGDADADICDSFYMLLPQSQEFKDLDLSKDLSKDLEKVEK